MNSKAESQSPWSNGVYSIKRHGVTINNCDDEPVQTPGCIQSHGALLALRLNDLVILQVSENCEQWLQKTPGQLQDTPVSAVIGTDKMAQLRIVLNEETVENNPLYAFTLPALTAAGDLDVMVHKIGGVVIVEFEKTGRADNKPDYYTLLKKNVSHLQASDSLSGLCQQVTEEFYALTGLDRVMVYRFHPDSHGEVIAETKRADLPAWLGLHYPAEDIPKPARDIFMKIWIRPVPDINAPLYELVPLANPDTGKPLELTYCALRGASIMYTEYLHNMGVAAALTMPIQKDGRLWGLIACHHYKPTYFSFQIRAACEFLAQVVSLQIKPVEERENLSYQLKLDTVHGQLIREAADTDESMLLQGQTNLMDGINSGGVALFYRNRWLKAGNTPNDEQLDGLANWIRLQPALSSMTHPAYVTDHLAQYYPPAATMTGMASGVLALPLTPDNESLIVWFRPEVIQTIHWAGSPHDKPTVEGPNGPRLTPRTSFELFAESVRAHSLPWQAVEIEAALRLRLWFMGLLIKRSEHLAILNADLTRSNEELDNFTYVASHDLKEPLRGIFKYAHQLSESALDLDEVNREKLASILRLSARMDNLLNSLLLFSRLGRAQFVNENVDLNEVMNDALEITAARRSERQTELLIPRPLPQAVCDRVSVREIFVNLISNALKYNDKPVCHIEIGHSKFDGLVDKPANRSVQINKDCPVFYVRDNGIGIEPRQQDQIFKLFKRLHGQHEYGGVGAGLTIVKMLVERHQGYIWLSSTPGVGTCFYFTLGPT